MMSGTGIRRRVLDGLASGKLWRLRQDLGKLDGATSGVACHVCERTIHRGQAYSVARTPVIVRVHLECYIFWLHASDLFRSEPVTCGSCRRLIPPHAEKTLVEGEPFHQRCWERMQSGESGL
jgi:hypothetical protein